MKMIAARFALLLLLLVITASAGGDVTSAQKPASDTPAQQQGQQGAPSLKLDTDLVSLSVTVTDQKGRAITGLKKEDFKVYENGGEQPISFFSAEERPASWGLVLDRSGSMREMIEDVYQAALHVIDEGTEQDEMFIVTFDDQMEIVCDLTTDRHKLGNSILGLRARGSTALWDAVAFALDQIRHGKHQKKVLVVITDGEDNRSRLNFRQLIERVEERNVLIYTVGMFESMDGWHRGMKGGGALGELKKLAEVTGAFAHFPTDVEQCRQTMKEIAREVSRQYSLGYYPANPTRDGKWRKIRVSVGREGSGNGYVARTRAGYYAPR
jgi:Ca-activated chloride channel family protein